MGRLWGEEGSGCGSARSCFSPPSLTDGRPEWRSRDQVNVLAAGREKTAKHQIEGSLSAAEEFHMETRTRHCSEHCQPEFLIQCDDSIPGQDVEWLIGVLENGVRGGAVYNQGDLVQIGWMLNRLSKKANAFLLSEPDMQTFPVKWTKGVTGTLRQLRLQKDTADSLGLTGSIQFPTMQDSAIIGVDVDFETEELILSRAEAQDSDSGWFIGSLTSELDYNDSDHLLRVSLYETAIQFPRIVMMLALPPGMTVECSKDSDSFSLDGETIKPTAKSFLDKLYASRHR
jgi:hypothetical protein